MLYFAVQEEERMMEIVFGVAIAATAATATAVVQRRRDSQIVTSAQFRKEFGRVTLPHTGVCAVCGRTVSEKETRIIDSQKDKIVLICDQTTCILEYTQGGADSQSSPTAA